MPIITWISIRLTVTTTVVAPDQTPKDLDSAPTVLRSASVRLKTQPTQDHVGA